MPWSITVGMIFGSTAEMSGGGAPIKTQSNKKKYDKRTHSVEIILCKCRLCCSLPLMPTKAYESKFEISAKFSFGIKKSQIGLTNLLRDVSNFAW